MSDRKPKTVVKVCAQCGDEFFVKVGFGRPTVYCKACGAALRVQSQDRAVARKKRNAVLRSHARPA